MNEMKLMDLIYDKLADNTEVEQFDCHKVQGMCVGKDTYTGSPFLSIEVDGKEYLLEITEVKDYE